MPFPVDIRHHESKNCLSSKFTAEPLRGQRSAPGNLLQKPSMFCKELSYHYTLPGLYPPDEDNKYRCFCKIHALLKVTSCKWLTSDVLMRPVPRYCFYWGCVKDNPGCGFCVPCECDGTPYRISSVNKYCLQGSITLAPFHFGICSIHEHPVAVFRTRVPRGCGRRYTFLLEGEEWECELTWNVPENYDLPMMFFLCPGAQRMECSHMYAVVRKNVPGKGYEEFVVKKEEFRNFFAEKKMNERSAS